MSFVLCLEKLAITILVAPEGIQTLAVRLFTTETNAPQAHTASLALALATSCFVPLGGWRTLRKGGSKMKRGVVFIGLVSLATTLAAQGGQKSWTFDTDKTGAIAKGFTNEIGEWKVVADSTAPSKPNALAQLAKNSGEMFNVTLVSDASYKDVDLSVKMKAFAGDEDQGGGLVWRAKDAKNYYIARYNPLEDNYRVYKVENGRRSQFQSTTIQHTDGWHTFRVTMTGDHIQCYYAGKKYLDVKDSTFKEAGRIGLWSKADAQSHFDDLAVSTP